MSLLTKWSPLTTLGRSEETDIWRPFTRWDPVREMEQLARGMQRFFTGNVIGTGRGDEAMTLAQWSPNVDIGENDNEFIVKAELPEVRKEDIKVSIDNGVLNIGGERKAEKEERNLRYHRVECAYGRFERSFTLPADADAGRITSEYRDGVLTVHLPKTAAGKAASHTIPVH